LLCSFSHWASFSARWLFSSLTWRKEKKKGKNGKSLTLNQWANQIENNWKCFLGSGWNLAPFSSCSSFLFSSYIIERPEMHDRGSRLRAIIIIILCLEPFPYHTPATRRVGEVNYIAFALDPFLSLVHHAPKDLKLEKILKRILSVVREFKAIYFFYFLKFIIFWFCLFLFYFLNDKIFFLNSR